MADKKQKTDPSEPAASSDAKEKAEQGPGAETPRKPPKKFVELAAAEVAALTPAELDAYHRVNCPGFVHVAAGKTFKASGFGVLDFSRGPRSTAKLPAALLLEHIANGHLRSAEKVEKDGDGVTSFERFKAGTDPKAKKMETVYFRILPPVQLRSRKAVA